jgi:flagellin-specific chaperone FliS
MPSVASVYQTNRAVSAGPVSRLLTVYDYCLRACENRRVEDLTRGLRVLMEGLDFSYPVANQLASLYQWCGELGRQQRYREAARLLQELRDTWAEAAKNQAAVAAVTQHTEAMESITAVV